MNEITSSKSALDHPIFRRFGLQVPWALSNRSLIFAVVSFGILLAALYLIISGASGPTYAVQPIIRGSLTPVVIAPGTLEARDQVDVGAEISGRIDQVYADFNEHVRKGQALAKLNTEQLEAQLAQARAGLAQARASLTLAEQTYPRDIALARNNAMSKQELDSAKADLLRARASADLAAAQVKQDETLLSKATIFSPIDGIVLDRKVSRGQAVVAALQTPVLFTVASDLSQMELDADIAETDVGQVRTGQTATFTVDAYPGRTFQAKLLGIHNAPKAVRGAVAYRGVLLVSNSKGLLKPGMTARIKIPGSRIADALLVPNAALHFAVRIERQAPQSTHAGRVWVKSRSGLEPHDLQLGVTDGRYTQVLAGDVFPGDQVATAGSNSVHS